MRRLGEGREGEGGVDEGAVGGVAVKIISVEPTKMIPTITPTQRPPMRPHRPTMVVASQLWRPGDVVDAAGGEGEEGPQAGDQEDARGGVEEEGVGEGEVVAVLLVNSGCLASLLVKCPTIWQKRVEQVTERATTNRIRSPALGALLGNRVRLAVRLLSDYRTYNCFNLIF